MWRQSASVVPIGTLAAPPIVRRLLNLELNPGGSMSISNNATVKRYYEAINMSFGEVQEWFRQADADTKEKRRLTAERTMAVLRKRPDEYTSQDLEHMAAAVEVIGGSEKNVDATTDGRDDWLDALQALGHNPNKYRGRQGGA